MRSLDRWWKIGTANGRGIAVEVYHPWLLRGRNMLISRRTLLLGSFTSLPFVSLMRNLLSGSPSPVLCLKKTTEADPPVRFIHIAPTTVGGLDVSAQTLPLSRSNQPPYRRI